jgi:hypothetical protein
MTAAITITNCFSKIVNIMTEASSAAFQESARLLNALEAHLDPLVVL